MIANYVKASLRKFRRTKTHTIIDVIGLTLGLVCALIIFQKIRYELSFDASQPEADRIYRVVREDAQFGEAEYDEGVPYPLVDAFRQDFPEAAAVSIVDRNFFPPVVSTTRADGQIVRFKEETGVAFVQPPFFEIFPYEWIQGDPATALDEPRTVVLTESLARKYFGEEEAMGKLLTYDATIDLTVTGIVSDPPRNSSVPLTMLMSFNLGEEHRRGNDDWGSTSTPVQCFIKLKPGMTAARMDGRLPEFLAKYRDEEVTRYLRFFLQPFTELHFDTRFSSVGGVNPVTPETLWPLGLIGLFLLITACINFINLNVVLVFKRAREVGIRKVLGASVAHIVSLFTREFVLFVVLGFALSAPIAYLIMRRWLDDFAYRTDLGIGLFAVAFAVSLLIALVTVGFKTYRAAIVNPVDSIRSD